jgi:hypothetical protein
MPKMRFTILFLSGLACGCASTTEGALQPPALWSAKSSGNCPQISGQYTAQGAPAPDNAHSGMYVVLWPTVGSLPSIIERGVNGTDENAASIRISVTGPASMEFSAVDQQGKTRRLFAHEWQCKGDELISRTPLSRLNPPDDSDVVEESVVRLWKSADGALIAENSVVSAKWHSDGRVTHQRSLAHFYFRFAPVSGAAGTP